MPVRDASLGEVIRRHLQGHSITGQDANPVAPQLACQMRQNGSVLIKLYAKQTAGELLDHRSRHFNAVFFTHSTFIGFRVYLL
jgi:hypothetical protein